MRMCICEQHASSVVCWQVVAYLFNDYWEDIGTIKSFFEANLALAQQVQTLHASGKLGAYANLRHNSGCVCDEVSACCSGKGLPDAQALT